MRAAGINNSISYPSYVYKSAGGVNKTFNTGVNPKNQQHSQNTGKAVKVIVGIAAIAAAIKFRKPLGKVLSPIKNAIKNKFPNFSDATSAVKGRAGRIFKPMGKNTKNWVTKTAIPNAQKAAHDTFEFTKDKAIPAVKSAGEKVSDFTSSKVKPSVLEKAKKFLQWITKKANSDLNKI